MSATFTTILVPTDFSETADAALDYAKQLARQLDASLHVLHVFPDPYAAALYAPEVYAPPSREAQARALKDTRKRLRERLNAQEASRMRGVSAITTGLTAKAIVKYAEEHGIDLIVMGTHGRRGVAHLLLGSVAEHIVRTAPCPVLTVRPPKAAATVEQAVVRVA